MLSLHHRRCLLPLLLVFVSPPLAPDSLGQLITPADTKGVAIIGDSLSDANWYREPCLFNTPNGNSEPDRNSNDYSWAEFLAGRREMPIGDLVAVGGRSYQRREFNLSRNCATSAEINQADIRLGNKSQAEYARDLAAAGRIDVVIFLIGHNDINPPGISPSNNPLLRIANNAMTAADHQMIAAISTNVTTAWQTIKAGNTSSIPRLVIIGMADVAQTAEFVSGYGRMSVAATRVRAEVDRVNQALQSLARQEHATFVDFPRFQSDLNGRASLEIGGETITRLVRSRTDATHVFQDGIHPRAVGNGVIANLILAGLNKRLNKNLPMLTDREILLSANIGDRFQRVTFVGRFDFDRYSTQY